MKRIAILAAALMAVVACNKNDRANTTDTATAGGAVAPASGDTAGAMSSGSNMSGSSTSGSSMSSGASTSTGTGMSSGSTSSSSSTMSDSSKMHDSTRSHRKGSARNQSQSGVTDSSGQSTLGTNMKKTSPTSGAPVTAKGDTLKKPPSSTP